MSNLDIRSSATAGAQGSRSLIGGLWMANISLVYVFLQIPSATFGTYVAYIFWPAYVGLAIAALV